MKKKFTNDWRRGSNKKNKIIGQSKDDFVYLLNGAKYIFYNKTIKNFVDYDNNMDENIESFFSLTTELMKNWYDEKRTKKWRNNC